MNPADYLRTYKIEELERIAYSELKKLGDLLTIPVDIDQIVENLNDIDIDVQRGLKNNHNTWGMVGKDLDKDRFIIIVDDTLLDSDHLRNKYRMTVSEEFAHVLLHRDAIQKVRTIEDFKALHNHGKWYEHERNAKRLAAALLMPAGSILEDGRIIYKKIVSKVGYKDADLVKKYVAKILSEKYVVSIESMKYRLGEWPIKIMDKIDQAVKDQVDFLD